MGRWMKTLKPYMLSILVVIGLLVVQAACELTLPDYTSKIIDTGIQGYGIEHVCPEKIVASEYESAKLFMDENEHYEIALRKNENGSCEAILRLNIGGIKHIQNALPVGGGSARLIVKGDCLNYTFSAEINGKTVTLGSGGTKYISSEVSGGFTGAMTGLYAVGGTAGFENFKVQYK